MTQLAMRLTSIIVSDRMGERTMFRRKDPQASLFEASNLFPEDKRERLLGTWAHAFRTQALPLIDENLFRDLFCSDNGRPNKPVQTVVGALILKDIMDLTDAETLYRLDSIWVGITPSVCSPKKPIAAKKLCTTSASNCWPTTAACTCSRT